VKTRLRPKHRRALLAALPPLAADLGDGRLVALAADLLADRPRESAGPFWLAPGPALQIEIEPPDEARARLEREAEDLREEVERLRSALAVWQDDARLRGKREHSHGRED